MLYSNIENNSVNKWSIRFTWVNTVKLTSLVLGDTFNEQTAHFALQIVVFPDIFFWTAAHTSETYLTEDINKTRGTLSIVLLQRIINSSHSWDTLHFETQFVVSELVNQHHRNQPGSDGGCEDKQRLDEIWSFYINDVLQMLLPTQRSKHLVTR
jgi:hypothetical protein